MGTRVTRTASLCLLVFYLNLNKLGVGLGCSSQCGHIQHTVVPLFSLLVFFAGISGRVSKPTERQGAEAQPSKGTPASRLLRAASTILPLPATEREGS